MAKLYFRYGAMGSSKTANILMVRYNYLEKGLRPLLVKPVLCYGLKTDFTGHLFEGSCRLLEVAEVIEEVPTVCWCGRRATFNARFDEQGRMLREGEQVVMGANEQYTSLCRRHYKEGKIRP